MSDLGTLLQPCIAELLRTCVKPNAMVLQVDKIVTQETTADATTSSNRRARTVARFLLTDGKLCIQSLLKPDLLVEHDLKVGDIVRVQDFVVRKARRLNGSGKVIYLGIQELDILSQHGDEEGETSGGFIRDATEDLPEPSPKRLRPTRSPPTNVRHQNLSSTPKMNPLDKTESGKSSLWRQHVKSQSADSDDFESVDLDLSSAQHRRQTLRSILQPPSVSPKETSQATGNAEPPARDTLPTPPIPVATSQRQRPPGPIEHHEPSPAPVSEPLAQSGTVPSHDIASLTPPYHPLSSLLSRSLPTKNYAISTLAVITYVSLNLVSKPGSPFPPKRNVKLLDATLHSTDEGRRYNQGIMLAVYANAKSFRPEVGTVALFRGIVMQRFRDDVILNAYANVEAKLDGEKWFIHDEQVLREMGFDVSGLRTWWDEHTTGSGDAT